MRNIPASYVVRFWVKLTINDRQYTYSVEEREVVSVQRDFKASERNCVYAAREGKMNVSLRDVASKSDRKMKTERDQSVHPVRTYIDRYIF